MAGLKTIYCLTKGSSEKVSVAVKNSFLWKGSRVKKTEVFQLRQEQDWKSVVEG